MDNQFTTMKMHNTTTNNYFQTLWNKNRSQWLEGNIIEASMNNGMPVPIDYCISTVARVSRQMNAPTEKINYIVDKLKEIDSNQFFYPEESRHITLLGCTQRFPTTDNFTDNKITKIDEVCKRSLRDNDKVAMRLYGLGIVGNQVFIQVFPDSNNWAYLREKLEGNLNKSGENPIAYQDKTPIHMNIMRITNSSQSNLTKILSLIEELREIDIGYFEVSTIDLLITDFVLSNKSTKILKTYHLPGANIHK